MSRHLPLSRGIACLFVLTVLGLLLAGCASTAHKLDGAWECISPAPSSPDHTEYKLLADGHFAFGVPPGDGAVICSGGGTYTYDGTHYVETVTYHWLAPLIGQTLTFDCRLKDGLWYHSGSFDIGGQPFTINEVWRRVGSGVELPPAPAVAGK